MSINFGLGANGKYLCELSSSDHELHPQDLKHRSGFIYGPTLVSYYTLNVKLRGKQLVFVFPRVLMFPKTKSRETSGLEGKQN